MTQSDQEIEFSRSTGATTARQRKSPHVAHRGCTLSLQCVLIIGWLTGCSMGPKRIRTDWRNYNQSVVEIEQQELLLNLVRLRYNDFPGVLAVAGITSQRNWSSSGSLGATGVEGEPSTLALGLNGLRSERPTVSFAPAGRDVVAAAVTPLPLDMLYLVSYMGWPAGISWPLMVKSINGIQNSPHAGGPIPSNTYSPGQFYEVALNMRLLQEQGFVEVGRVEKLVPVGSPIKSVSVSAADRISADSAGYIFENDEDSDEIVLNKRKQATVLRFASDAIVTDEFNRLVTLLNLDADAQVFEIEAAYEGSLKRAESSRTDIEIGLRSVFEMLFLLSRGVQVPACDLSNNVAPSPSPHSDWNTILGSFQIRCCDECPTCASIAVEYRDKWFYIDSRDQETKRKFFLLKLIFDTQVQGGGAENLPQLTLPL